MPNIQINIKDKVARGDGTIIICDNSDYIAHFDFDSEWDEFEVKTMRVKTPRVIYPDIVFSGTSCALPIVSDTLSMTIGVFAGDLHTTTPAYFACVPSILCGGGVPADPTPDVYNQLMELLNKESGVWYPAVDDAGNMSWTRSISETEPQPVNIKGPKGDAGADGIGSPGADGKDGVDGKSAYELAQDNGFQGTMQEWLASLVGADGTNGVDGNDGVSPAVSVAAITGGNRVTITDAEGAKTFDVMDGAQGASGADGKDYVLTDTDKQEIAEAAAGFVDVPSVQHDWNQNDETQPDYIKNRPFYTETEEITLTFNPDDTYETYGGMLCKISNDPISLDEILASKISLMIVPLNKTVDALVTEENVTDGGEYYSATACDNVGNEAQLMSIFKQQTEEAFGADVPIGVYIAYRIGVGVYVNQITYTKNTLKQLDAKFIPDMDSVILNSSTADSTKKFKITVDDNGSPTIKDESDSTNTWKPTNLPTVTASDAGKFLRVSDTGEWVADTIPNASGVNF